MKTLLAVLLILLSGLAIADDSRVEVIQIMSQPATSLVDSVRPLLGEHGSVSAYHDRLIVRGSRAEIAAVRAWLKEIDRPARRLIIEVRQGGRLEQSTRGLGYAIGTENLRLGRVPPGSRAQIGYQDLNTRARDDSLQRVQALDGRPALIRTGQSVPSYEGYRQAYGNRVVQGFHMQYRDVSSGFVALPRVHGNQVTIEIYQQHESATANGRFNRQQASTVLDGGLGEWLTLGSIGGEDNNSYNELGRHVQTHRAQDRQLQLRVIPVD